MVAQSLLKVHNTIFSGENIHFVKQSDTINDRDVIIIVI
jgi:hypothetical protein